MINIFHKTQKNKSVQKLTEYKSNSWVYVENPSEDETKKLAEKFYLEPSLLQDALDQYEVPRVEVEDDVVYLYNRMITGKESSSITSPILFAIRKGYLITVSLKQFPQLNKYLEGTIPFSTLNRNVLLIQLLNQILTQYKTQLNRLSKQISSFTSSLEKITNKDIVQFVIFENILNELNSTLIRMESIYRTLHSGKLLKFSEDELDLVEDLSHETVQLIQISKDNIRTIVNIREAYSTIMTNNLNHIITIFTSLTVILTIPTIIGSFFGMNVPVPLANNPYAFFGIVGITLLITVIVIVYFIKKHWL